MKNCLQAFINMSRAADAAWCQCEKINGNTVQAFNAFNFANLIQNRLAQNKLGMHKCYSTHRNELSS